HTLSHVGRQRVRGGRHHAGAADRDRRGGGRRDGGAIDAQVARARRAQARAAPSCYHVRVISRSLCLRITLKVTLRSITRGVTARVTSARSITGLPSTATITSPLRNPAR